jgi:hypothetical protein
MAEVKVPVTINLIMTADVTDEHPISNPQCMAVMEEVLRGHSRELEPGGYRGLGF